VTQPKLPTSFGFCCLYSYWNFVRLPQAGIQKMADENKQYLQNEAGAKGESSSF
jgi:hypothetical protein